MMKIYKIIHTIDDYDFQDANGEPVEHELGVYTTQEKAIRVVERIVRRENKTRDLSQGDKLLVRGTTKYRKIPYWSDNYETYEIQPVRVR